MDQEHTRQPSIPSKALSMRANTLNLNRCFALSFCFCTKFIIRCNRGASLPAPGSRRRHDHRPCGHRAAGDRSIPAPPNRIKPGHTRLQLSDILKPCSRAWITTLNSNQDRLTRPADAPESSRRASTGKASTSNGYLPGKRSACHRHPCQQQMIATIDHATFRPTGDIRRRTHPAHRRENRPTPGTPLAPQRPQFDSRA